MKHPYCDVVDDEDAPVPAKEGGYPNFVNVGVFIEADPDVTFMFGEVHGERLFLSANFTAICFEHPELAS